MKDVTIISKVVGRKEGDRPVTGGGPQAAVDLSAYLLKKTWDTAWELREKDGVPYLFGKLPVVLQSGMTSYVADEAVDLPGIYDGLPIDNQTLKWVEVTDESGAVSRVLVAAGGGTGGGGGSVQFPLTWSGFSNGSWDGSDAKTIEIPSKLSDLENDGKFFEDYGWTGADANEQSFGSYVFGGVANSNTPIDSGQLLAFNAKDGGYRGFQMFMYNRNYYYRQHWDNEWKPWRKVISGNVDGVIDSDLTIDGKLFVYNNINLRGQEGGDIEFVYNPNGSITNIQGGGSDISIRHALRFKWYGDSYEIGTVRGGGAEARGFGVTYGNNTLIFEVGLGFCDFHTPVNLRQGLFVQGSAEFVDNVKFDKPISFVGNAGVNDISFVYNEDGVINNKTYKAESIRHALRFQWFKDAYEIGAVRTGWDEAFGFGVTYNNNLLVWKVNTTQMDVYEDLKVHGDIRLYDGDNTSKYKIVFGDGDPGNVYLYEDSGYFLNIYADGGMKLYTQNSKYIEMAGMGIKVNNGIITYNESGGYFQLDGNLLVTGGITAFADSGAGNQWILDATSLSGVTSTNQYKVYSARVTKLLKDEVDEIVDKIAAIKSTFNGLSSSSSASAIGSALKTLAGKL